MYCPCFGQLLRSTGSLIRFCLRFLHFCKLPLHRLHLSVLLRQRCLYRGLNRRLYPANPPQSIVELPMGLGVTLVAFVAH
jgi:hypothetical protein